MTFNAADCAMEGLRVVRKHPGAFALWCVSYLIFLVVLLVVLFAAMASVLLQALTFQAGSDPAGVEEFFQKNWPLFLAAFALILPVAFVWSAMMACAIYRIVLRPDDNKGFGYMRLGADEFRLMGLYLLTFLLGLVAAAGVAGLFVGVVMALGQGGWTVLACMILGLALFCLYVLVVVRLSLCAPQTFAERRINLFGSWTLTRTHFWELLGMYLLVFLLLAGIAIANSIVQIPLKTMGAQFSAQHDMAMTPLLIVGGLISLVLTFALGMLNSVVAIAPKAAAYRALTPRPDTADAFS